MSVADGEEGLRANRSLPAGVVLLIGAAAAVIAVAGIRSMSSLAGSVLLALVLTVSVLPVGRWALRRGWPGWAAVTLTILSAYAILAVLIGGLALSIVQLVATLPRYEPRVRELTTDILNQLKHWGIDTDSAQTSLNKIDINSLVTVLRSVLSAVVSTLGFLAFLVVLLFFMTADALSVVRRRAHLLALKPEAARVLADFTRGTQRYLLVSALFGAIVAVLDAGALWLLGVPLALTWGLLSFLTNFVPNIGFVLGVAPPALLALLDQGWAGFFKVLIIYTVLNVVIQVLIQPRFVGDSVGLNATTTFLALAFWGFVLGPLGALLAVPATLLVRAVFIDADPRLRWVMLLFGSATPKEPPLHGAITDPGDGSS